MNVGVPFVAAEAGQLHARRCARHAEREAAARCPDCRGFFCRECVVEHRGKFLCAACLERAIGTNAATARRRRWRAVGREAATLLAGVFVLWLLFYGGGALLEKLPPDFHDGTIWKKMIERSGG